MRTFLALLPDPELVLAIDAWTTRNYPVVQRRVAIQNLHLTVCFLGDIDVRQRQIVEEQLDSATIDPFDLTLNSVGYFPESGALWLGCESVPKGFAILVSHCRRIANRAGIRVDKRTAIPHFTLARRVENPVASPLEKPEFLFQCSELCLLSSRLTSEGPHYEVLTTW